MGELDVATARRVVRWAFARNGRPRSGCRSGGLSAACTQRVGAQVPDGNRSGSSMALHCRKPPGKRRVALPPPRGQHAAGQGSQQAG